MNTVCGVFDLFFLFLFVLLMFGHFANGRVAAKDPTLKVKITFRCCRNNWSHFENWNNLKYLGTFANEFRHRTVHAHPSHSSETPPLLQLPPTLKLNNTTTQFNCRLLIKSFVVTKPHSDGVKVVHFFHKLVAVSNIFLHEFVCLLLVPRPARASAHPGHILVNVLTRF